MRTSPWIARSSLAWNLAPGLEGRFVGARYGPGRNRCGALHHARAEAESDRIRAKVYGYGAAAAGAGAVPVPIVGVGGLAGILAIVLRALSIRYGVAWTPGTFAQFSGAVGGGALTWWTIRYGLREMLKLIPLIGTVGRSVQRGGSICGHRRHRRGRLCMAGLSAPWPPPRTAHRIRRRGVPGKTTAPR
jgi:hypothetical protein